MNRVAALVAWAFALTLPLVALAQPGDSPDTYAPGSGPPAEEISGMMLMVSAYAIMWLLVLAYVVRLGFLHSSTIRSLERVEKTLADGMARNVAKNDARTESDH